MCLGSRQSERRASAARPGNMRGGVCAGYRFGRLTICPSTGSTTLRRHQKSRGARSLCSVREARRASARAARVQSLDTLVAIARRLAADGVKARHARLADGGGAVCSIPLRVVRAQVCIALRKDDYVAAFKTLPLNKEDLDLAVCTWRAAAERGWGLQMFALPFGGRVSGYDWERFAAAGQLILENLFAVPSARYVDDQFGADDKWAGRGWASPEGASDTVLAVTSELLGWELDPGKRCRAADSAIILGVLVEFCVQRQAC